MKQILHMLFIVAALMPASPLMLSAQTETATPEAAAEAPTADAAATEPAAAPAVEPGTPTPTEETAEPVAEAGETPVAENEAAAEIPEPVEAAEPKQEAEAAAPVWPEAALTLPSANGYKWLMFNATLQTFFLYKNDSDFDPTPPVYDANGQSVGLLGTFFKPRLTLMPVTEISIVWEMELGLNLWSRHDPDQYQSGEMNTFRLAQRELYVEGRFLEGVLGFKVGYQFFEDPSRLFIGHWVGAASLISEREWAKFSFTIAQVPGQTFEGITLDENNFIHDTFVYGLRVDAPISNWKLTVGLYGLHDAEVVDQTLNLFTPTVQVQGDYEWVSFGLDLAYQTGITQRGAMMNDEQTDAWALQAYATFTAEKFEAEINQLILSADDGSDRNGSNGAFFYSGKSRSRTLILTEDEIRDTGANLDEGLGEGRGKFHLARPGLSITDAALSYRITDYFAPTFIIGAGFVLEADNALGGKMIGVECDLDLKFSYKNIIDFHVIGGLLMPGHAAGAYFNEYDHDSKRLQYMLESSLSATF